MTKRSDDPNPAGGDRDLSRFELALQTLAHEGVNWVSFVPASVGPTMPSALPTSSSSGLLVLLALGPEFGRRTSFSPQTQSDPFDARSLQLLAKFTSDAFGPSPSPPIRVYPGNIALDLRSWLEAGAVQFRSPIGIGIRPDCGPWLAVRAALWAELSSNQRAILSRRYPPLHADQHPCDHCHDKPCATACPPGAIVQSDRAVRDLPKKSLQLCIDHRLRQGSNCAWTCRARQACPVGREFEYAADQLKYHYGVSLEMIRSWAAPNSRT